MSLAYHISLCICLGLLGPLISLAAAQPAPGEVALVVAPPWVTLPPIIESAGGQPIGPVGTRLASFAQSDDAAFFARVKAGGAWFVLDGRAAAGLCGVPT
ncbi:MAG: hypothetical protein HKN30_01475 [Sulfitobacter sp.]|nr:hypothetical protein [Sulfitobacter sp.]